MARALRPRGTRGRGGAHDGAPDSLRAVARADRVHGRGCEARAGAGRRPHRRRAPPHRPDRAQGTEGRVVAIIVDAATRLLVQGITGREGSFHATRNQAYGTNVVAGVTPGKGGAEVEGIPVFDSVREAVAETAPNTAMVFVPARFAAAAFIEAEMTKPVVAYIAGFTAPPGKTMGHAGAIISGSAGTAHAKKEALEAHGVRVGTNPTEVARLVAEVAGARA